MKSMLLDCSRFIGQHDSMHIRDAIFAACDKWGIQAKIHAIVTDNAANMKLAVSRLGWQHLPCMAHTINLVVKDAIKQQTEEIRTKAKAIVEYFHRSTSGSDLFKSQQMAFFRQQRALERQQQQSSEMSIAETEDEEENAAATTPSAAIEFEDSEFEADQATEHGITTYKLINDVETRWNSTLHMYERLCKLRNPLVATLAVLKDKKIALPNLEADDFQILKEACDILRPFEAVTKELSKEKQKNKETEQEEEGKGEITGSKALILLRQLMKMLKDTSRSTRLCYASIALAGNLLEGLVKRYPQVENHLLLAKATFLDPRFKKHGILEPGAKQSCRDAIQQDVAALARDEEDYGATTSTPETHAVDFNDMLWGQFDRQNAAHVQTPTNTATIEIRQYVEEPPLDRRMDPLDWWRSREVVYPRLAKLARKNLSLVPTSVPSERVFSSAGEVLSKKRNRLSNKNVQKLVVLHGNQSYF